MVTWEAFAAADPDLAAYGRARIGSTEVAYLATIRSDGGPRVHPITPVFAQGGMWVFMEPTSPKGHDLRRDPRYAMHATVEGPDGGGGEFFVAGRGRPVDDPAERQAVARPKTPERYVLFELGVDEVLAKRYEAGEAIRSRWAATG